MTSILSSAKQHIYNAKSFSSPIAIITIHVIVSVDILVHPITDDYNLYHHIISKYVGAAAPPSPRVNKVEIK